MLVDIVIFCGMIASILTFFVVCAIYELIKRQVRVNETQVMAQMFSMLDNETLKEIFKD